MYLKIELEQQYPYEDEKYALVAFSRDHSVVIREGGNWSKEDAIDSAAAFTKNLTEKGYVVLNNLC